MPAFFKYFLAVKKATKNTGICRCFLIFLQHYYLTVVVALRLNFQTFSPVP